MRKALPAAAAFAALIVTTALSTTAAQASARVAITAATGDAVAGEYIVTTRPGSARALSAKAGGAVLHVYEHAIHGFAARLTEAQLRALQRDRDVQAIEPNQVVVVRPDSVQTPTLNSLAASGVFVAVSGGSSASDACNFSPQGASGAFAVIRSTQTDTSATSNNFGPCIKMHAPGTSITSTWLGTGTATLSGTAMASAHVAGVAAMLKDAINDVPNSVVNAFLLGVATSGVLTGVHPQAPNLLLYTNLI